ncbi:MAG: gliding motility-associated ABC transporter ATP-binding subunit GldA [Bacteroidia bacterium]
MSVVVENITKLYGEQKALDDVSFQVQQGEVLAFLGPNGAGKSTMMKILTCFIPQTLGKASVCGFDVTDASIKVRQNVGYLPENNPLYTDMYVKEYLEFAGKVQGVNGSIKKRVAEMIEVTGLQVEQKKRIGALSKGYRQRVGLAQALIHDPKVLILDEPTSGLDPNQLVEIRQLIKNLGSEKTVILSTHIMQEVRAICDRVIIINKGKIVVDDKTENIVQHSGKETVIVVEFDKATTADDLNKIKGVDRVEGDGMKWKLVSSGDVDIRKELHAFMAANDLAILALQKEEHDLEDVFQQLTKK